MRVVRGLCAAVGDWAWLPRATQPETRETDSRSPAVAKGGCLNDRRVELQGRTYVRAHMCVNCECVGARSRPAISSC